MCFSKSHSDIFVGIHLEVWKVWTLPFNKFYWCMQFSQRLIHIWHTFV